MNPFNNSMTETQKHMHWEKFADNIPSGANGIVGSWKIRILREARSIYAKKYSELNNHQPIGKHRVILIVGCEPNYYDIRDTMQYQGHNPWVMDAEIKYERNSHECPVEIQTVSPEFAACWQSAVMHLDSQVSNGIKTWFRVNLRPPFMEHLSFRLEEQSFFIQVSDFNGRVQAPSSLKKLVLIAREYNGRACLMKMTKKDSGAWVPIMPGWGLIDVSTGEPVSPLELTK